MATTLHLVKREPVPVLLAVEKARAMLAEARSLEDVKKIRDVATAMKAYARAQKAGKQHEEWSAIRDEMVASARARGETVSAYEVTREQTKRMWARGERPARLVFEGGHVRILR